MSGLKVGDKVYFGSVICTIVEVRHAIDGSWTDYRLETPQGGLLWANSRRCSIAA